MNSKPRKHPIKFTAHVINLLLRKDQSPNFVKQSYNNISVTYDQTWTNHMRDLTEQMIDRIQIQPNQTAIDLTCGTGYATNLVAERTKQIVTGIDASDGMLQKAKQNYPDMCQFICSDIIGYLKTVPDNSIDVVTCCWGLGYSKPLKVIKHIRRILKKGGKVGIIDNTLFSLKEVMYSSMLTYMEQPDKLQNLMKFRFLTGQKHLNLYYRLANLQPTVLWASSKSYFVESGKAAIERLTATGAAAGFEYATTENHSKQIFDRFAEILEQKYMKDNRIEVIHRYVGGIAIK